MSRGVRPRPRSAAPDDCRRTSQRTGLTAADAAGKKPFMSFVSQAACPTQDPQTDEAVVDPGHMARLKLTTPPPADGNDGAAA